MNSGVSVLIPTRQRPHRLQATSESAKKYAGGAIEVLTYVDDDDDSYPSWTVRGPRFERAKMFRALIQHAQYDHYLICADDVIFETPDWDLRMQKAIPPDHVGGVFGIDGWKNVPGHILFHKRLVELTGAFPDEFEHFGLDTYLADVMRGVGRLAQIQVMLRHMHERNGKAENDETYRHPRTSGMNQRDEERLKKFRKSRMPQDIATLKAEIERFNGSVPAGVEGGAGTGDEQT